MKTKTAIGLMTCLVLGCSSSDGGDSDAAATLDGDAGTGGDSLTDLASGSGTGGAGGLPMPADGAVDGGATPHGDVAISPDAGLVDAALDPDAAVAAVVQAPVLLSVRVLQHGTMSLSWTNPEPPCDVITINRNKDGGAYAPAQTVTGAATSANDMPGHTNGNYCYTLTCTLDGVDSMPSNERCAAQ